MLENSYSELKYLFLIAPALFLVNAIISGLFYFKYRHEIYRWSMYFWLSYLVSVIIQGLTQTLPDEPKAFIFAIGSFFVCSTLAQFCSLIIKDLNIIFKRNFLIFIAGFGLSVFMLFALKASFEVWSSPVIFASVYPLISNTGFAIRNIKKLRFSQMGLLLACILIGFHGLDFIYAGNKAEFIFFGYLIALMLAMTLSCFSFACLIEKEVIENEVKDLLYNTSRMASLGELSAEIAHEIKNPVHVISLNTHVLKTMFISNFNEKNTAEKCLDIIDRMTGRINAIVSTLRQNSQNGQNDNTELVSLKQILSDTIILCESRAKNLKISINYEMDSTINFIECRAIQISQVILNLIQNSLDALEFTDSSHKWIKVIINKKNENFVVISVVDSGHGIPSEIKNKIFEPLFTTKKNGRGTGLGLSISQRAIADHGGTLSIDSESKNTKIDILLPISGIQKIRSKVV